MWRTILWKLKWVSILFYLHWGLVFKGLLPSISQTDQVQAVTVKHQATKNTPGFFSSVSKAAVRQCPCGVTDTQTKAPTLVLCRAVTNKVSVFLVECINFKRLRAVVTPLQGNCCVVWGMGFSPHQKKEGNKIQCLHKASFARKKNWQKRTKKGTEQLIWCSFWDKSLPFSLPPSPHFAFAFNFLWNQYGGEADGDNRVRHKTNGASTIQTLH